MSRRDPAAKQLVLGGEPRVQLLPPSVRLREKAREARRLVLLLVVLAVAIVGAGYSFALFHVVGANAALDREQTRTQQLLDQQVRYAPATRLAGLVELTERTRESAGTTEVLWAGVLGDVLRRLPAGTELESASLVGRAPWDAALPVEGVLRPVRAATVQLGIRSAALPDAVAWSRALRSIDGVVDVVLATTEQDDGYITSLSLTLSDEAVSGRFAQQQDADAQDADEQDAVDASNEGDE